MNKLVHGTFEVKINPLETNHNQTLLGRMSIDKTFLGPLAGKSLGEMLTARTEVDSSAGYVAIERFLGTLDGKKGSFVLQHFGIVKGAENRLFLEVVPDSGTEDLKGISGNMEITRKGSDHEYDFNYTL